MPNENAETSPLETPMGIEGIREPERRFDDTASALGKEIAEVLNRHSRENASNTPDFILASYLLKCLEAFDQTVSLREEWYGRAKRKTTTGAPPTGA